MTFKFPTRAVLLGSFLMGTALAQPAAAMPGPSTAFSVSIERSVSQHVEVDRGFRGRGFRGRGRGFRRGFRGRGLRGRGFRR